MAVSPEKFKTLTIEAAIGSFNQTISPSAKTIFYFRLVNLQTLT